MTRRPASAPAIESRGGGLAAPTAELRLEGLSNRTLHLILLPTEACNFRCRYCYETFAYKRMERPVIDGVLNWIDRRAPGLQELTLSWFGGEPLLAADIVEEIMIRAQAAARAHPAISLVSDMTTNGFLLGESRFDRLTELGVADFQISFDGPPEHHDRKRVMPGGKGTFDKIWSNLIRMRASSTSFRVVMRIHVDRENQSSIPELIDRVARDFESDDRFVLFIRPLSRLGGANDASLNVLTGDEARRSVDSLRALAEARGLPQLVVRPQSEICYAARGNSFVVRSNGRINKCTVAMEHPANQVGRLREDGTLAMDPHRLWPWMRGLKTGDPAALRCPMIGLADPVSRSGDGLEHGVPVAVPLIA